MPTAHFSPQARAAKIAKFADAPQKLAAVDEIRVESSMLLADFAERAFAEGYSLHDVWHMLNKARGIVEEQIAQRPAA